MQNLGPLLNVKLLVGYIKNPTKFKGAKGIKDYQRFGKLRFLLPSDFNHFETIDCHSQNGVERIFPRHGR